MGSRRSFQTPEPVCETVWQVDEAATSSTQRSQLCFFFLLFIWSSNKLICKWTYGLVAWGTSCCRVHHGVRSKYASVHAYYPMVTSSSCMCGSWRLNRSPLTAESLSQATYYLSSREQGSMPTRFSIAFAGFTKCIRVYLVSRFTLDSGTLQVLLQGSNGSFRYKENAKGPFADTACPSVHCLHEFSTWIYQRTSGGSSTLVLRRVVPQVSH